MVMARVFVAGVLPTPFRLLVALTVQLPVAPPVNATAPVDALMVHTVGVSEE